MKIKKILVAIEYLLTIFCCFNNNLYAQDSIVLNKVFKTIVEKEFVKYRWFDKMSSKFAKNNKLKKITYLSCNIDSFYSKYTNLINFNASGELFISSNINFLFTDTIKIETYDKEGFLESESNFDMEIKNTLFNKRKIKNKKITNDVWYWKEVVYNNNGLPDTIIDGDDTKIFYYNKRGILKIIKCLSKSNKYLIKNRIVISSNNIIIINRNNKYCFDEYGNLIEYFNFNVSLKETNSFDRYSNKLVHSMYEYNNKKDPSYGNLNIYSFYYDKIDNLNKVYNVVINNKDQYYKPSIHINYYLYNKNNLIEYKIEYSENYITKKIISLEKIIYEYYN